MGSVGLSTPSTDPAKVPASRPPKAGFLDYPAGAIPPPFPDWAVWLTFIHCWPLQGRLLLPTVFPLAMAPDDPSYENPYAAPKTRVRQPRLRDGNRPLASRIERLFAIIIDSLAISIVVIPMLVMSGLEVTADGEFDFSNGVPPMVFAAAGLSVAYLVLQFVMLWTKSQTVGKRAMNIRIDEYTSDRRAGPVKTILIRGFVSGILGSLPLIGFVFAVVDILFIFGKEKRCIHDLLAGTVVRKAPR